MLLGPGTNFVNSLEDNCTYNGNIYAYTVSEESRTPAGEDTPNTLDSTDLAECLGIAAVKLGIDLTAALDQVQWGNGSVSNTLHVDDMVSD